MLLVENALTKEIKNLLNKSINLRIAVAFIGDGAEALIGKQVSEAQIICNLSMGGTNPYEVKKLIKRFGVNNVKHIDNLHAKLYIGDEYAIVGSANMSSNGLGVQPDTLKEAGYKFKLNTEKQQEIDWYTSLWTSSKEISKDDLESAMQNWDQRNKSRNGEWKRESRDICDYDFNRDDFPLLAWYTPATGKLVENIESNEDLRGGWATLQEAADNSVDIESGNDLAYLTKSRWIISFQNRINAALFWRQLTGTYCLKSWRYDNDEEDNLISIALTKNGADLGPFKIDEDFLKEFRELLFNTKKYHELKSKDYEGDYFDPPRINLMREFWKELQSILCKQKK